MSGKRPDDWTIDQIDEMAHMAEKLAANIAKIVHEMKEGEVESLVLQARKKWTALHELVTWSQFDLGKSLERQSAMRAKATFVAESAKKSRRK